MYESMYCYEFRLAELLGIALKHCIGVKYEPQGLWAYFQSTPTKGHVEVKSQDGLQCHQFW